MYVGKTRTDAYVNLSTRGNFKRDLGAGDGSGRAGNGVTNEAKE